MNAPYPDQGRLLEAPEGPLAEEEFSTLLATGGFRLERIISMGHATEPGVWLEQAEAEWVCVVAGAADLRFADEEAARSLATGDFVVIAPGRKHRVEWTSTEPPTVWLALHWKGSKREC